MDDKLVERVCMIGIGYIGLPTAVVAASAGLDVLGYDTNEDRIRQINRFEFKTYEPNLVASLTEVLNSGKLSVSTDVRLSDVYVICVPTPVEFFNGTSKPNLEYVHSAINKIVPLLKEEDLLIIESTCPVGTTNEIANRIAQSRSDIKNLYIAYCPERILPGNALVELVKNNRVVGGIDEQSALKAKRFYQMFVSGSIIITNAQTAEMCKIVENAYRDVNIAFSNEISMISPELNVNIHELIDLANMHPRVSILQPGVGVGGHCLPVDPWFLIDQTTSDATLMRTARNVNLYKTEWTRQNIETTIGQVKESLGRPPKIAVLGVTYKADTEDCRESPAMEICKSIAAKNEFVRVVDPHADQKDQLEFVDLDDAVDTCDIFILLVPHKEFRQSRYLKARSKDIYSFCES